MRAPRRAGLLAVVLAGVACGGPTLPLLGVVPPFTLTERSGRPLGDADLRGHVSIVDFVFTRCPDVCPLLTKRMAGVQAAVADAASPILLVSISVDPGHDTPEVLRTYADANGAGSRWFFLGGGRDAVMALLRDGFHVAYGDDGPAAGPITHSDRFVLVDGRLRIRGYYHGSDPEDVDRLVADARALARRPDA